MQGLKDYLSITVMYIRSTSPSVIPIFEFLVCMLLTPINDIQRQQSRTHHATIIFSMYYKRAKWSQISCKVQVISPHKKPRESGLMSKRELIRDTSNQLVSLSSLNNVLVSHLQ